jgi:hypothetical protein
VNEERKNAYVAQFGIERWDREVKIACRGAQPAQNMIDDDN